jgi:hypothetical protein
MDQTTETLLPLLLGIDIDFVVETQSIN